MTNIYVAGPREMAATVRAYMTGLERHGYTVTRDWTATVGGEDEDRSPETLAALAQGDMAGIRDAAILWLLAPEHGGTGCWVEMGYALGVSSSYVWGWHRTIVVSGAYARTLFTRHPGVHKVTPTHEAAYQWLVDRAGLV